MKREAVMEKERRIEGEQRPEGSVLFYAALFHSGTPLVACSTAEAASQSPLLVRPVTLHHWGQRALFLPDNEPASTSVHPPHSPPPLSKLPQFSRRQKLSRRKEELFQHHLSVLRAARFSFTHSGFCDDLGKRRAFILNTPISWDRQISADLHCKFPVPLVVTVHPCNQIMPAEGSGTKTCKF